MGKVYAKLEFTLTFKPNNALEHLFHRLVPYKLRFLYFPPIRVYLWYFFIFFTFQFFRFILWSTACDLTTWDRATS